MRDTPPSEVKILLHGNLRHGSFISSVAAGHTNQKEARWYFHSSSSKSHTLSFFIISILFAFFAPEVRNGIWQWPWNPTTDCFYVSRFTGDLGDLSLLYVTVPFMSYIDHQGVQPLSRKVHYRRGIFHIRRHLIHISFSVHIQRLHTENVIKNGSQLVNCNSVRIMINIKHFTHPSPLSKPSVYITLNVWLDMLCSQCSRAACSLQYRWRRGSWKLWCFMLLVFFSYF